MVSNKIHILVVCLLTNLAAISHSKVIMEEGNSEIAFLLRVQWPPGKCVTMGDRCEEDLVQDSYWTIHGLWTLGDCETSHEFDYSLLTDSLTNELNRYWPNIKSDETNKDFWKSEYEKHGCAANWDQLEYFRQTLDLYQRYRPGAQLSQVGVTPGGRYSIDKIESAFDKSVKLKCNYDNSLSELEFCFDEAYNDVDCNEEHCLGDITYLSKQNEETPYLNLKIFSRVSW